MITYFTSCNLLKLFYCLKFTKYDCVAGVNMRNKKKREDGDGERVERPMSWEGELSDSEMPTIKPVFINFLCCSLNICIKLTYSREKMSYAQIF